MTANIYSNHGSQAVVSPRFAATTSVVAIRVTVTTLLFACGASHGGQVDRAGGAKPGDASLIPRVYHRTVKIEGQTVFYREAGPARAPNVLLLHGFPTSSHMFRNLIPALADRYHVVAPDYPGYGQSSLLSVDEFEYTFDHLAAISPDNWTVDQGILDREGNQEIQLALFHSYGSNPPLYPKWQAYFRQHQPPTLLVWGKNDPIFPEEGAHPYKRDLDGLEFHILDTGHFALEEDGDLIAGLIRDFLGRNVGGSSESEGVAYAAGK